MFMMARLRMQRAAVATLLATTPIVAVPAATAAPGVVTPSVKERRAVRGRPVLEPIESEDQATLRRFEASLPELPSTTDFSNDLEGAWHGSGDEVLAPTSAATTPTASTSRGTAPASPVPLAELYLDFFSKDPAGRAIHARAMDRLAAWWEPCEVALAAASVPPDVVAAALALTGFESGAAGVAGEAGPWLLTATQARAAGLRVNLWTDERRDPVRATEAAAANLAMLHQRFGSWPLALLAHHAGPELIEQALVRVSSGHLAGDLAQLTAPGGPLPRPSRLFLAKVVALTQLGFPSGRPALGRPSVAMTALDVPGAVTLATVARLTRIDLETLRELNPALIGDRAAPFAAPMPLRVPATTRKISLATFDHARGIDDDVRVVTLKMGESARLLAATSGVGDKELCRLNRVQSVGDLRGGIDVLLPASAPSPSAAGSIGSVVDPGNDGVDEPPLVAVPARAIDVPGRERAFYFVAEGDTLDEIAEAANVTSSDIVSWNNLDSHARLQAKMVLQLFVAPELDRTRIALVDATKVRAAPLGSDEFHALEVALRGKSRLVYSARLGDTMPKIARRYGLTAPDLARINRMSWNSQLFDGQRIVVYAPSGGGGRETAVGRSQPPKRRTSRR